MRDPKRILQKLLGPEGNVEPFAETDEPLEQAVGMLRDVVQCRKIREYVGTHFGFDLAITPEVFYNLLDIPQINFIETTKRDLEVETVSLKEIRDSGTPVAISNLNSVLRELYASLFQIKQLVSKDYPNAVLIKEMRSEHIDRAHRLAKNISILYGDMTGYLFTGWKAGKIDKEFLALFPNSKKAHPLRSTFPLIEHELELYREILKVQKKWEPLQFDLFAILHKEDAQGLNLLLENIQELGNRLWQIIYQSSEIQQCVEIAGLRFGDIHPLFDNTKVALNPLG